ncbi:MAG: GspH/FimT family pseudopilin [Deltaproteobacteria bacterium]|nr:GspH/FimT family pseudopilin [Deltaproteobacteria bacterium]MBW1927615.1 GspH/FimT family pseudopilin [Deltaproteobacteria bacterium]MBW2127033.1 GspH/FimT family pseudopilin [Deltaproteobacteria bacterium]RLB23955.1 MAG: hypothetical protein DRG76_02810 [Deltaproteobacteria bacterium]
MKTCKPGKVKRHNNGFTSIELMVVLGILIIAVGIAIPVVSTYVPRYKLRAEARKIYSDMQRARLEAVKRNRNVIISFTPSASPGQGTYTIFVDDGSGGGTAGDGTRNGSEQILTTVQISPSVSLYGASFTNGGSPSTKTGFTSRGLLWNNLAGDVFIRSSKISRYYKITLTAAGGLRMSTSNDGTHWS